MPGRLLSNARIVTPGGVIDPGWLEVADGKISEIGYGVPDAAEPRDLRGCWLLPGFVDMHVHGGGGATFQSGTAEAVAMVTAFHRSHGTTTMVASLVTAPIEEMVRSASALAGPVEDGLLAGIHLEGPFLSPARRGAHDPALLRAPSPADVDRLIAAGRGTVRMVTLAPELEGGVDAVRRVVEAGPIAAVGHTDATYDTVLAALDAGATVATHLFNGMRPLDHREPGPIVALLDDTRVTVELIVDYVHLHPAVVKMVAGHAGADRVALVTDAMVATGVGDGDYVLGGLAVRVEQGIARLVEGGSIAGSTLTMDAAVRNAVRAGLPVGDVALMAATNPARLLGLDDRVGGIQVGLDADLVVLDHDFNLVAVMAKGSMIMGGANGRVARVVSPPGP